jgi:diphthamide synthase subunit DPH2
MENITFKIIAKLDNLHQAYEIKNILEANDIPCFIDNENMQMLYAGIAGGCMVKVREEDFLKAKEILEQE